MSRLSIFLLFAGASLAWPGAAGAQRVVETIGADADVHDVVVFGGRTVLATSGGLHIAEGDRLVAHMGVAEGMPGARLRSLSVVGDRLFVGAIEGLAELDENFRIVRSLPLRRVRRVARFAGSLWAAGYAGLAKIDGDHIENRSLGRSSARRRLTDAMVVGDELWIASAGAGVLRVDEEGRARGRITRRQGLRHDHVWDLARRGDDILIGTLDGVSIARAGAIVRRHALSRASSRLPVRDVRRLLVVDSAVHAVTFGGGVRSLESPSRDSNLRAHAAALTGSGLLIAHDDGATFADGSDLLRGGLPSADISALARAFGRIWIGTFGDGLATMRNGEITPMTRATTRYSVDGRINDLAVTGHGRSERLWIATDRGLFWHDGRRYVHVEGDGGPGRTHVTSLHVDGDGDLWVTSSRVLSRWSRRQDTWQNWDSDAGFPVAQLHAVATHDGQVWVGSLHGLYRFDPRTGRAEAHTVSTGDLPVDWVTALASVGGHLVAGTYHGGLSWRIGDSFRLEGENQGLPAGWVNPHAMKAIDGALYIGTLERGLLIGRRGDWHHLRVAQGLPSDDVTDVLSAGSDVWVATRAGLARISAP